MSDTPTILAQESPAASTATKLYTGVGNGAIAKLEVNNRPTNDTVANIQLELRKAGAATAAKAFIWEIPVAPGDPKNKIFAIGVTDEAWITSDQANVNFNLTGILR